MLAASGSPLVAGTRAQPPMKTVQIQVTRAFLIGGKPQAVGTVVEVPAPLAAELVSANKAERVAAPAAAAAKPVKPTTPAKET